MHKCSPEHSSRKLAHENSRVEISQRTEEEGKQERVKMEGSKARTTKISSNGLTVARAYRPPGVATP